MRHVRQEGLRMIPQLSQGLRVPERRSASTLAGDKLARPITMLKQDVDTVAVPMARDHQGLFKVPARYSHALRHENRQRGRVLRLFC